MISPWRAVQFLHCAFLSISGGITLLFCGKQGMMSGNKQREENDR